VRDGVRAERVGGDGLRRSKLTIALGVEVVLVAVYALKQLWNAWNGTPELQTNLAGWNALANESQMMPCVPDSPWRGVFCDARPNATAQSAAASNYTVWDLDIVGL